MSVLSQLAEDNADLTREVNALRADNDALRRENVAVRKENDEVRSGAVRWETECHALRRENGALRQNRPTDRIDLEPHDMERA
jgi:regulator of replication initiation timing